MRWRVTRAIAHVDRDAVDSSLGNAGGGSAVGSLMLINLRLKLLEELINVLQVVLGAQMGNRKRVVLAQRLLGSSGNSRRTAVFLTAEAEVLDVHQTLTDSVDVVRIKTARLDVSEEFVQGIIGGALTHFVLLIQGMVGRRNRVECSAVVGLIASWTMVGRRVGSSVCV